MIKHTPAPWIVAFRNDHSAYISMGDPSAEHKQFDIDLTDLYPSDVADAKLIAAAPLMLEALIDLLDDVAGTWSPGEPKTYAAARVAIAAATGEQP